MDRKSTEENRIEKGRRLLWLAAAGLLLIFSLQYGFAQEMAVTGEVHVPPVVATVNGKPITAQAYHKVWRQVAFERGGAEQINDPKELTSLKEAVLDRLITLELLDQRADQLKIQSSPDEVIQRLTEIEIRNGSADELDRALASRGMTRREFAKDVENTLRMHGLLDREVFDKISVTSEEARAFYESTPKAFEIPEQIRARHIVIRVPPRATEGKRKRAEKAIEKAAERIRSGEPFDKVAKEVSQDRSRSRGGDIGYFNRGQTPPEFERVAFSLEAGQVSDVPVFIPDHPFGISHRHQQSVLGDNDRTLPAFMIGVHVLGAAALLEDHRFLAGPQDHHQGREPDLV